MTLNHFEGLRGEIGSRILGDQEGVMNTRRAVCAVVVIALASAGCDYLRTERSEGERRERPAEGTIQGAGAKAQILLTQVDVVMPP